MNPWERWNHPHFADSKLRLKEATHVGNDGPKLMSFLFLACPSSLQSTYATSSGTRLLLIQLKDLGQDTESLCASVSPSKMGLITSFFIGL
jgi:hypothetical protein